MSSNLPYQYITTLESLIPCCKKLATAKVLCVDTEFHREKTYFAQFALMQVSSNDDCFIIDPVQIKDLKPLWDVLHNPDILKVFHAGRQDLEIILEHSGALPLPLFDTQIAAALLGYGQQVGFGNLVQRLLKKELPKGESFSDWLHRPLTSQQMLYAADDVIYLMPIFQALKEKLQASKRFAWLEEEQATLTSLSTYQTDLNEAFWRVKGVNKLKPKQMSILREIAAWRETEAQKKDIPRRRLLADEPMLELAKRDKLNIDVMGRMRGLNSGVINRFGETWLKLWEKGLASDPESWPQHEARKHNAAGTDLRLELLDTLVRLRAEDCSISATILASKSELSALASWGNNIKNPLPKLSCLHGWRNDLVGNDLVRLLKGELCLRLSPNTGLPVIDEVSADKIQERN
ncbi:MAG: ribonuclease D [Zetaproteobacteria bacterium CG2_30_46_52]|nr:MAG: ribonuclease D [Zetaproteobacteria bacterium CG2_30_46_52]